MLMTTNRWCMLVLFVTLLACGEAVESNEDDFADCLYERPEAIFSKQLPEVLDHDFIINGRVGIERIVFDAGPELEIHQSGCDELQQNFFFEIDQQLSETETIAQAAEFFYYIGTLDEAYLPLYEWGSLIEKNALNISLDQSYAVFPGFYVTIKQYKKKKTRLLEVMLSEVG